MKKKFFENVARLGLPVVLSVLLVAVGASAATTISTNINTGGTLDVTGATTLSSTLGVTGKTTMVYASSTGLSVSGALYMGTASSTGLVRLDSLNLTTALGAVYGGTGIDSSALSGVAVVNAGVWSASSTIAVNRGGTGSTTLSGILKGNGTGVIATAVAGVDYVLPSGNITGSAATAASSTLLANENTFSGTNTFANATTTALSIGAGTAGTTIHNLIVGSCTLASQSSGAILANVTTGFSCPVNDGITNLATSDKIFATFATTTDSGGNTLLPSPISMKTVEVRNDGTGSNLWVSLTNTSGGGANNGQLTINFMAIR